MPSRPVLQLLGRTWEEFRLDEAPRLAAELAFFTVLSLAPLLVVLLALAGVVWDGEAARQALVGHVLDATGPEGVEVVNAVLDASGPGRGGTLASLISAVFVVWGATKVVAHVHVSLNRIWNVRRPRAGVLATLRVRLLSLAIIALMALVLVGSVVVSSWLSAFLAFAEQTLPGPRLMWSLANGAVATLTYVIVFAVIYRVIPDARIAWRDVLVGATVTGIVFSVGQKAVTIYLAHAAVGSPYGAAGSLVVLLVWLHISSMTFFLGAELTQVWSRSRGRGVVPIRGAEIGGWKQSWGDDGLL